FAENCSGVRPVASKALRQASLVEIGSVYVPFFAASNFARQLPMITERPSVEVGFFAASVGFGASVFGAVVVGLLKSVLTLAQNSSAESPERSSAFSHGSLERS